MIFYSFRMPLFFILSGIFIGGSLAKRSLSKLLWIKFDNLMYPYFIWAFIQISLQVILVHYTNSDRGPKDYLYILYQPRELDQFWYLPALFNTTMIYLLVKTKLKPPAWMQLVLGLALYFTYPHLQQISMLSDWMEFYFFFALGDTIATFFFRESSQRFLNSTWPFLVMIPVFIAAQLFYLSHPEPWYKNDPLGQFTFMAIALIGCFTMLLLAFRLQAWKAIPFIRVLGFHSLYIYVMHVIVAAFVRVILTKYAGIHQPVALLFLGITFGATLPVIFYNLLIKDGPLWFLMSYKKPSARPLSVT
jgi:fucose 4-O-acetylase-like acetyltransferase